MLPNFLFYERKTAMNIITRSSNGITLVPVETKLFEARKIIIKGEINFELANEFIGKIIILNSEDKKAPIDILINSYGGEINAGLLIYDIIRSVKVPVRTYCIGAAYSMAALLFASGTGGRYMLPHSELMLHEPLLGNRVSGNASSIRSISDTLMETREKINRILAEITGKTTGEIEKATGYDHYFSAKESIAFGLADKILDDFSGLSEV